MTSITLIIAGTESTVPKEELSIERIIAEAHSMGYQEFSVFCNDKEIEKPEDFKVIDGATYIIASAADQIDPDSIQYEILEEDGEPENEPE
ncbi:MAG: hypothetical protein HOH19_06935 [Kordiimonadaceae bacterium]|jgi:hypothetical protein|nr:hypothetical protein [Kordiimonadaceae bacterium]MBT6032292.1 hypothetical protein [Kordiimonadaceae bacterium]